MAFELADATAILKSYYSGQVIENMFYRDNPFLAMVKKRKDFFGDGAYKIPIITGAAQGASASFSEAIANQANITTESFSLTRKSKFKIASVNNELIDASSNDKGSFVKAMRAQIDGAFTAVRGALATELYGSGTGIIGTVSGSVSTGVVTLSVAGDVNRFERNMVLKAYATGGGAVRAGTGYVIAVNRAAGTLTVSATALAGSAGTPSGWVTTDDLVVSGNLNAVITGLDGWLTTPAASGDSFFGVNRAVDPVRLAGVVSDLSSLPIQEAFNQAAISVNEQGGSPDYVFCSYSTYTALTNAMAGKIQYVDLKGAANIAFPAIQLPTPKGMVKVVPDRNCPANTIYMLTMDAWTLFTLGDCPKYIDNDSLTLLRDSTSNSVQLRIGYYGNLYTNAPGWSGKFTVGA